MENTEEKNITTFNGGMNTDISPLVQEQGSYRYALNTLEMSDEGEQGFISNEESNLDVASFPLGYIPIGKVYIGDGEICVFLVNPDENISEIGVFNTKNNTYVTVVNDTNSPVKNKLLFNIEYQIQATYRLRRGCEKIVYWTDNLNPPRNFNFGKINYYKQNGQWTSKRFSLFKKSTSIPRLINASVVESQGLLKPGSYTIMMQYLDADQNATQWHELISNIYIYNDSTTSPFKDIHGSIRLGTEKDENLKYYQYEDTNKAIEIEVDDLDYNFSYVRYAIIEYTSGIGVISNVVYSDLYSINNRRFVYDGRNAYTKGSIEEVKLSKANIDLERAAHIEQIENRLILANTHSKDVKPHLLQKYASKIATDCTIQSVELDNINDPRSIKNPLLAHYGIGYQAGEVYSFGIIYQFENGDFSPVFHIPGKNPNTKYRDKKYTTGDNIFPMSNRDNVNINEKYESNSSCENTSYWGKDAEGFELEDSSVRHHRFPTRKELGIELVETNTTTSGGGIKKYLVLTYFPGTLKPSVTCKDDDGDDIHNCTPEKAVKFELKIKYTLNGTDVEDVFLIDPDNVEGAINTSTHISNSVNNVSEIMNLEVFTKTKTETNWTKMNMQEEVINNGGFIDKKVLIDRSRASEGIVPYIYYSYNHLYEVNISKVNSKILGVKFSNIEIPSEEEIGEKIVGYKIVRLHRNFEDKTIIDSGVILPVMKSDVGPLGSKSFESYGNIFPHFNNLYNGLYESKNRLSKKSFAVVNPEFLFKDRPIDNFTSFEIAGYFKKRKQSIDMFAKQDAADGSSATGKEKDKYKDADGMTLKCFVRDTELEFVPDAGEHSATITANNKNSRLYSLDALEYFTNAGKDREVYNIAMDNKSQIVNSKDDIITLFPKNENYLPYVYIKREHKTFYSSFRSKSYQEIHTKILDSKETPALFGGDCYIAPLKYSTNVYAGIMNARRYAKTDWGNFFIAAIAVIAGVAAFLVPGLQAAGGWLVTAGASLAIAGGGLMLAGALVKNNNLSRVYTEKWDKGLNFSIIDYNTQRWFYETDRNKWGHPMQAFDDTYLWLGDVIGTLWFETQYNTGLRVKPKTNDENFVSAFEDIMPDNSSDVESNLTDAGRAYSGVWLSKDFERIPRNYIMDYFFRKLLTLNKEKNKWEYNGISKPVTYVLNADYNLNAKVREHYALPLSYDYCSSCVESYPHRIYYSNQSFQEELTDNYVNFLPNNYRDIEGETGEITNIFRLNNNLFVHTKEALWQLPRNYQERVTDQIVSFIGTGSYFEIPPQKLVDDETGLSAGTTHKWASIKTPVGYFFVSANQGKIYQLGGEGGLKPITNIGMSKWFNENITNIGNNPSNPESSGYISVYDSHNERVIFTKLDKIKSWTISFSLLSNKWVSFHSYKPNIYLQSPNKFYSWKFNKDAESNKIWEHNIKGSYQTFYGKLEPHILEYISVNSPVVTKVWDYFQLNTQAQKFINDVFVDDLYTTFNKGIFYNSRQCSGELTFITKDTELYDENYMESQIKNYDENHIIIDRTERNWFVNDFRDIRTDYSAPIWKENFSEVHKNLNMDSMDINKDWFELENFRDKYLGIRLIFDKFADKKLITNFSVENTTISEH